MVGLYLSVSKRPSLPFRRDLDADTVDPTVVASVDDEASSSVTTAPLAASITSSAPSVAAPLWSPPLPNSAVSSLIARVESLSGVISPSSSPPPTAETMISMELPTVPNPPPGFMDQSQQQHLQHQQMHHHMQDPHLHSQQQPQQPGEQQQHLQSEQEMQDNKRKRESHRCEDGRFVGIHDERDDGGGADEREEGSVRA